MVDLLTVDTIDSPRIVLDRLEAKLTEACEQSWLEDVNRVTARRGNGHNKLRT